MIDLVRDAPIGGLIRHIFGKTTLPFPDEKDDFKVAQLFSATPPPASRNASTNDVNATTPAASQNNSTNDVCSRDVVEEKADASAAGESTVGWYDDTDPENPQNYSMRKKCFIQLQICFFTWTGTSHAGRKEERDFADRRGGASISSVQLRSDPRPRRGLLPGGMGRYRADHSAGVVDAAPWICTYIVCAAASTGRVRVRFC